MSSNAKNAVTNSVHHVGLMVPGLEILFSGLVSVAMSIALASLF